MTRRAKATRWIVSLNPMFVIINKRMERLGLGTPRVETGPTFLPRSRFHDHAGDRIRRGAIWYVGERNCGFHVDFCAENRIHIEAWTGGERHTSTWISGDVSEASLNRDLAVCLVAAGLTDLAKTEEVRAQLFSRTAKE